MGVYMPGKRIYQIGFGLTGLLFLLSIQVFLASMKRCVLNSGMPYSDEDVNELDSMISYLLENRNSIGLREWGGLFSLRLSRGNVKFVIFHTEKNKEAGQKILKRLECFCPACLDVEP